MRHERPQREKGGSAMGQAEEARELAQGQAAEELLRNALAEEQKRLKEERRSFEREKKAFDFHKEMEEKRLGEEKRLFQLKWKVLEGELQKLAKEKQEMEIEKERYCQRAERRSAYSFSGSTAEAEMFFSGVDNELALKKRYKELIKIFHPDNLSGDTGTLQMINRTYDSLKKQFLTQAVAK